MKQHELRILLIDDDQDDYVMTRDLLADIEGIRFELEWLATYDAALEAIERHWPDVYLLDYRLGKHNGLDFLREAIARDCRAPIILLTGQGDQEVAFNAMRAGAADYLVKGQIDAPLLERSIRYALERKQTELMLLSRNSELALKNQELSALYDKVKRNMLGTVRMFSTLLETYDDTRSGHSVRVATLARGLAARIGLSEEQIEQVEIAARLHDIGLLCLPQEIARANEFDLASLSKPGLALFLCHPEYGQQIVSGNEQFTEIGRIIRAHHERYDGSGYPDRLAGKAIPLGARIIAVVNQFDRIAVRDHNKNSMGNLREPHQPEASPYLRLQADIGLDSHLVSALLEMLGKRAEQERAPVEIELTELRVGMVLVSGISNKAGLLLLGPGTILQEFHLVRLNSFNQLDPITEKILVRTEANVFSG